MMAPNNNDCSFLKENIQHACLLTFSGLTLPHQEGSSSVLQIQKEPFRVTTSDLPEIPPAEVGDRKIKVKLQLSWSRRRRSCVHIKTMVSVIPAFYQWTQCMEKRSAALWLSTENIEMYGNMGKTELQESTKIMYSSAWMESDGAT